MKRFARAILITAATTTFMIMAATPVAATSPSVYTGALGGPTSVPGDGIYHVIAGIPIPAGTWLVKATAVIDAGGNGTLGIGETTCQLFGDDGSFTYRMDLSTWALVGHPDGRAVANVYLTSVITVPLSWTLEFECLNQSQFVSVSDVELSASTVSASSSPMFIGQGVQSATIAGNSTFHTVGALSVPKGKWTIVAKANIVNDSSSASTNEVCRVKLSSTDVDQVGQSLSSTAGQGYAGEVVVQVAHNFTTSGVAALECKGSQSGNADHIVLIGLKAGKLTIQPIGGTATVSGSGTPSIVSAYKTASVSIANGSYGTVASLKLPAGNWLIEAQGFLKDASPVAVSCSLTAGTLYAATYSDGAPAGKMTGIYLQTGTQLASPGKAVVACDAAATGASISYIRITAIKAGFMSFAV